MDIKFRSHILNSGTTFRSCIPARYKIQDGLEAPVTWQFCFPSLFFARFLCVCVCVCCVLVTQSQSDSTIPWTVAHQAPLSMEFSRQEYWCGWPFPSPGDLPHPGMEPGFPALQADSLTIWAIREAFTTYMYPLYMYIGLFTLKCKNS